MISDKVKEILNDKMTILTQENNQDLCLVGPVKLPVQLDNQVVTFQWYTWLPLEGLSSDKEKLLESLVTADLAQSQQSSVLVYGDFQHAEEALSACIAFVIQEIFLAASVVIAVISCINR